MQNYRWHFEQPADCDCNKIVQFPPMAPVRKSGIAAGLFALLLLCPLVLLGSSHLPKYVCVGLAPGATGGHWHRGSR